MRNFQAWDEGEDRRDASVIKAPTFSEAAARYVGPEVSRGERTSDGIVCVAAVGSERVERYMIEIVQSVTVRRVADGDDS